MCTEHFCYRISHNKMVEAVSSGFRIRNILHLYHKLLVTFGLFAVFIFVLAITSSLSNSVTSNECNSDTFVKKTHEAVPFRKLLNYSVDPCNDFYSFCCNKWQKNRSIISNKPVVTAFHILQEDIDCKLRNILETISPIDNLPQIVKSAVVFYRSCILPVKCTVQNLKPLYAIFAEIGGWPLIDYTSWNENNFSWTLASARTYQVLGLHTFIGIYVSVDFEYATENILIIGSPMLPSRSLNDNAVLNMLYLIIKALNSYHISDLQILSEMHEMKKFEKTLKSLFTPYSKFQVMKEARKMSIGELQQKVPQLNWLKFIQDVTNDSFHSAEVIANEDYIICVFDIEYLKNIINLIESSQFSKRVIANFIGWVIVNDLYLTIPGVFKKYSEMTDVQSNETMMHLKHLCYEATHSNFPISLSYLYINSISDYNAQGTIMLIEYLKIAFKELVRNSHWISYEMKASLLSKLDTMKVVLGYPKILQNIEKLNKLFENFPVFSPNALQNIIFAAKFSVTKAIQMLRMKNSMEDWIPPRPISDVSAYYVILQNVLVFPLSMHKPPFYYEHGPWYLNFGAIGSIIGHEITHVLDLLGQTQNKSESFQFWWPKIVHLGYEKRSQCFLEQFKRYKVNSTKTLRENIADSGGLRQAYVAYKAWENQYGVEKRYPGFEQFSSDQMLYISFASVWCSKVSLDEGSNFFEVDTHSPPSIRVTGAVSNSENFAKAFNCKKRQPMNPEHKCVLW